MMRPGHEFGRPDDSVTGGGRHVSDADFQCPELEFRSVIRRVVNNRRDALPLGVSAVLPVQLPNLMLRTSESGH
jgi:hypothetical protein